jgi:hypothetical protein
MSDQSLKHQAERIVSAVDQDLQGIDSKGSMVQTKVNDRANAILETLFNVVSDVDLEAAATRVRQLKAQNPDMALPELSQKLVRDKCQRTGAIGAVTSGAGLIPGIGTAAAVTLGVAADIGATFKLQAELVLELAALYDYPLTEEEKQRVVMLITGLSAGTTALARRAGQQASFKIGEKLAEKSLLKVLPVIGVVASAGTNVLSTYIIGQRADAYFRLGPDAVGSWSDSLRAISGLDERKIGSWLAENGKATGAAIASGVNRIGEATWSAGSTAAAKAGEVAGVTGTAIGSSATKAGQLAQRGFRAYLSRTTANLKMLGRAGEQVLHFIWRVVSFVPRKIIRLFWQQET